MNRSSFFIISMLLSSNAFGGGSAQPLIYRADPVANCQRKTQVGLCLALTAVATAGTGFAIYNTLSSEYPMPPAPIPPDNSTKPEQPGDGCRFISVRWCIPPVPPYDACTYYTFWPICPELNASSPEIPELCRQWPRELSIETNPPRHCWEADHCYSNRQVKELLPKFKWCERMSPPSPPSMPSDLTPRQKLHAKIAAFKANRTGK